LPPETIPNFTTDMGYPHMKSPVLNFKLGGEQPIRRLGYGALHLTGPGYWGPPENPANAIKVLRRAVELGVNFIDTADSYGPDTNEEIIRLALHPYPDDLVICSKGGLLRSGPMDWSPAAPKPYIVPCGRPAYLRQQVEMSLRNLGTDCIGLYELHRIDPAVPLADQLGELARLRQEGKIRYIGVSGQPEVTVEQLKQCQAVTEIAAVENLYNIAAREGEAVIRYCESQGIAFIPWFPLGHGELTRMDGPLAAVANKRGVTSAQLALAWLLYSSPNVILIPGTTSVAHLEENMEADQIMLDPEELESAANAAVAAKPWRPVAPKATDHASEGEHPNITLLRTIYADLTQLKHYAAEDIILHTAERELMGAQQRVIGRDAVDKKARELIALTNGTLVMDVEKIIANDCFGAVTGMLRGQTAQGKIAMPFCGLWRFNKGVVVEHWENAYDARRFFDNDVLSSPAPALETGAALHT
jgi:aryl-alcohol dehydrogenase-like predicted oxidoreductase